MDDAPTMEPRTPPPPVQVRTHPEDPVPCSPRTARTAASGSRITRSTAATSATPPTRAGRSPPAPRARTARCSACSANSGASSAAIDRAIVAALALLSVATLLKMVPPGVDEVRHRLRPHEQAPAAIGAADLLRRSRRDRGCSPSWRSSCSCRSSACSSSLWSRWIATRTTKRVQMEMRRRAFAHAARLPLHRVYGLKSGGAASLLREDAGGIGELVFSMLYNPWSAIVQLLGGLAVLAWVDWRLLVLSAAGLPLIYCDQPLLGAAESARSTATSAPDARTSTPPPPRPSAACGSSAPSAASAARRPDSSATTTSWPARSSTSGGGTGSSRSPGT